VRELLRQTADLAADFLESVPDRPVFDVEERGLTGAPRIRVFAGEKAHSTFPRVLRLDRARHGLDHRDSGR
jgi:hypothetical protein